MLFWVCYDNTLARVGGPPNGLRLTGWHATAWRATWRIRNGAQIVQLSVLMALGGTSFLVYLQAHWALAAVAVAAFITAEVLAICQRAYYMVFMMHDPSYVMLLVLEIGGLGAFFAMIACFESETCAGGAAAAPVYEYALFSFFETTVIACMLDVD